MKRLCSLLLCILVVGCGRQDAPKPGGPTATPGATPAAQSLAEARKAFQTKLSRQEKANTPLDKPPANVFEIVRFDAPTGKLGAYLSPDPKDGKKHPAIIWITGGDCNTIDRGCWQQGPPNNDQSAGQYRKAGIIMMFPSMRGGSDSTAVKESFLGEVDDVIAAAEYLKKIPYVDPGRIYLGGHSTGGTMALLVAESSDLFRSVFSFGPADSPAGYPDELITFPRGNAREAEVRAPINWLASVKNPTYVIEGTAGSANITSLNNMKNRLRTTPNANVHCLAVKGGDHFNILAPANTLIAQKILADDGPTCTLTLTEEELSAAARRR